MDDIVCLCGHSKDEHRSVCMCSCLECDCKLYVPNHDHPLFIDDEDSEGS